VNEFHSRGNPLVPQWWKDWLNLTWMLYGWWAREHQLNMQGLALHWFGGPRRADQQRASRR
jgi:hypothetical protein